MTLTAEQRKKLIELYPYLQPRNLWAGKVSEDYDYSYIRGEHELPEGWIRLFFLYCKNLRSKLVETDTLDKFRFSQLKEKYGRMCLYNFGIPKNSDADILTSLYESYSTQICHVCGKLARYESLGWIEPWCESCADKCPYTKTKIYTRSQMGIGMWNREKDCTEVVYYSFRKLAREYKKCLLMTDEEFYQYIITV